MCITFYC